MLTVRFHPISPTIRLKRCTRYGARFTSISEADGDAGAAVAGYREALALYESMQAEADVTRVRDILARLEG